jgi:hypothetical protein
MSDFLAKAFAAIAIVLGVLIFLGSFGLLLAFPVKWCWNATMPYLFALKEITWGQAWCLDFLAAMLIKSSLSTTTKD